MTAPHNNLGALKPSSVSAWKKKAAPTVLPSGNAIILKKTSLAGFLQTGNIPNALMGAIQKAMGSKTGQEEIDVSTLLEDPDALVDIFTAVDSFMISVAVEPRVYPVPEDEADRREDLLYVDEIDSEDKMFVFQNAVGGAVEAEPFRPQPAGGVAAVPPRKAVGSKAKPASRRTRPV